MHSPTLPTGTYYILDNAQRLYMGRSLKEDLSILPKPVISVLPRDGRTLPKWKVERQPSGRYVLKIANAPVGAVSGGLFAFLSPMDIPAEWSIRHCHGTLYTIEMPEQSNAWLLPEQVGPHSQVLMSGAERSSDFRLRKSQMFSIIPAQ